MFPLRLRRCRLLRPRLLPGCRQKGFIPLSTYLTNYKLGDYVDVKCNPAVHKVRQSAGQQSAIADAANVELPALCGGQTEPAGWAGVCKEWTGDTGAVT